MKWGLGIEKEFPILIGPYKYEFLQYTTGNIKTAFDTFFFFFMNSNNEISTYLRNMSQSLVPKESYLTIDGSRHIDDFHNFHLLPHLLPSDVKNNFGEFYYNFTSHILSSISLYNEDFVDWISKKIKILDTNKNIDVSYFKKFYSCFTKFVLNVNNSVIDDLLHVCLYYKLIFRVKHDVGMLFKNVFLFDVPDRKASIYDEIYTEKKAYVFKWMDECFNVLRARNYQAFVDRTQYQISRSKVYGTQTSTKTELGNFINWDFVTFVWYEENVEFSLTSMKGTIDDKFKLEADSGGTEIRTFDGPGETFANKTVGECVSYLNHKEKQIYTKVSSLLSENEKRQNIDVVLEITMASFFKPVFLNLSTDKTSLSQSLPKKISYDFTFIQEYTGENEINLTLPYLQFHTLTKEQNELYFIKRPTQKQPPENSPSDICIILEAYENKKCSNSRNSILEINFANDSEDIISLKRSLIDMWNDYCLLFEQRHINVMKALQLLSPLFVASFTGVQYLSFGDESTIPETSKRFQLLGYRFLTGQNIDAIYDNDDGFHYYDIVMNKQIREVLKNKGIDPEPNAFEFSVNRKHTKKHNPNEDEFFGFEWKVMDQYPTHYLPHILLFIVMLAQHIENLKVFELIKGSVPELIKTKCDNFVSWIDEVIFQGWNSSLDSGYTGLVCSVLQVPLDILNTNTCFDFLQSLHGFLYDKFVSEKTANNTTIILCFFPDFFSNSSHLRNLPNINKENYNKMMDDFSLHFPESFKKIINELTETDEDFLDYMAWVESYGY